MFNSAALKSGAAGLKKVEKKKEEDVPVFDPEWAHEETEQEAAERRKYFFDTGIDSWYDSLKDYTFKTEFIPLTREDAKALLVKYTGNDQSVRTKFVEKLDDIIQTKFNGKAFIKLSTRSPKDATGLLAKAEALLNQSSLPNDHQELFKILCESMIKVMCVSSGSEALELMLTSERVQEDLEYALDDASFHLSILVREWKFCPIQSEFRGFVWGGKLNAIGQYYHYIHFDELEGQEDRIGKQLLDFFDILKGGIPFENYIVDFVALEDGTSYIVEVNPFDGVLGCVDASTGLWSWDNDRDQMKNGPFQIRLCKKKWEWAQLKFVIHKNWVSIIENHLK